MARTSMKITFLVHADFDDMWGDLVRIQKELNMTDVVLEGINAMQQAQRTLAPIGTTGRGPHGRIPRNIQPARVYRRADGSAWAESRTSYGPAIFTSEGTGQFGPRHRPYFVATDSTEDESSRGYMHPGQRGTGWWVAGAQMGEPMALLAFQAKIERVLRLRRG
jgi:hypothetical protein